MERHEISPEMIRDLFDYDQATGRLLARKSRQGLHKGEAIGRLERGRRVMSIVGLSFVCSAVIWCWHHGDWPAKLIRRRDGDPTNDRIENLRMSGGESEISADEARSLFVYDPDTGDFAWRRQPYGRSIRSRGAGSINDQGYHVVRVANRPYRVHRLIWLIVHGSWPNGEIDHVNGCRSDNRLENLRDATRAENNYNQRLSSRNKSGHKGVTWEASRGKWFVSCRIDGKTRYIGRYASFDDAVRAYEQRVRPVHGDFFRAA